MTTSLSYDDFTVALSVSLFSSEMFIRGASGWGDKAVRIPTFSDARMVDCLHVVFILNTLIFIINQTFITVKLFSPSPSWIKAQSQQLFESKSTGAPTPRCTYPRKSLYMKLSNY